MISVIITAWKEPESIKKAIKIFQEDLTNKDEILVFCPDKETAKAAEGFKGVQAFDDAGGKNFNVKKGKPAALNEAVKKAKGDLLVFTDGDVYTEKNALKSLLEPLKDKKIGAVCGHPVPTDNRNSMFGFWAYVLTEIAHKRRLKAVEDKKRFFCSGYLFAIRKELFPSLPEELLSEDGFISHQVYESGSKIDYASGAKVYVKYPNNFKDWIKQKKRSVGGYNQIKNMIGIEIRSFKKESSGAFGVLRLVSNPKEFFWLCNLFLARIYLWILIYIEVNLRKKSQKDIWVRIESTK